MAKYSAIAVKSVSHKIRIFLLALAAFVPLCAKAAADDQKIWEPFGYLKQNAAVSLTDIDHFVWSGGSTLRGAVRFLPADGLYAEAALNVAVLEGSPVQNIRDQLTAFNIPASFHQQLVPGLSTTVDISRAFFQIRKGIFTTIAGKSPFNQGATFIFAPVDIFNSFDTLVYEDEKPAFWNIQAMLEWGVGNKILLAVFPDTTRDSSRYLLRTALYFLETDIAFFTARIPAVDDLAAISINQPIAMHSASQWLAGAEFSRTLFGPITLRADGMYYFSGLYRQKGKVAIGLDYQGSGDVSFNIEYLFDKTGGNKFNDYTFLRLRSESGVWTLAQHYAAFFANWQTTALAAVRATGFVNLLDGSGTSILDWTQSLAQDFDLRVSGYVPWGGGYSEFGAFDPGISASLKIYF